MVNLSLKNIQSLSQSLNHSLTLRLLAEKKWKPLKPPQALPSISATSVHA
jgi:hypothetical protein